MDYYLRGELAKAAECHEICDEIINKKVYEI